MLLSVVMFLSESKLGSLINLFCKVTEVLLVRDLLDVHALLDTILAWRKPLVRDPVVCVLVVLVVGVGIGGVSVEGRRSRADC